MIEEIKNTESKENLPLVVLSYGISFDKENQRWISIEATRFDPLTNIPISWAIRIGNTSMSKKSGFFDYEPSPSNRDEEFFKEYRFDTPSQAYESWLKFK